MIKSFRDFRQALPRLFRISFLMKRLTSVSRGGGGCTRRGPVLDSKTKNLIPDMIRCIKHSR